MQRRLKRLVGWAIWATLFTWAIMMLCAVVAGVAFHSGAGVMWAWATVGSFVAVAALALVAWLVANTDQSSDEPRYRL
jgi:hypothetical protein